MEISKKNLFMGIVSLLFSIWFFVSRELVITKLVEWTLNVLVLIGLLHIVNHLFIQKKEKITLITFVQLIVIVLLKILNQFTLISASIVVMIIGLYQMMIGLVYFITFILYVKHQVKGKYRYLFDSILLIGISIITILNPVKHLEGQYFILGVYLLFLSFRYLREGLFNFNDKSKKDLRRKIRFHVPIVFEALIPGKAFDKVNELINRGVENVISNVEDYNDGFEIFVHATQGMQGATGHVDICIDNQVISYGCYDTLTTKFFGMISDGTLIKCNREEYLNFCKETKDLVFGYSVLLNSYQKKKILNKINEIDQLLIKWDLDVEEHKKMNTQAYQLYTKTSTQFYKFKKSKYKTYFIATTNCCVLADYIIGEMGSDILNMKGFITPGTYKNYLDQELNKENSFITDYRVY